MRLLSRAATTFPMLSLVLRSVDGKREAVATKNKCFACEPTPLRKLIVRPRIFLERSLSVNKMGRALGDGSDPQPP